MVIIQLFNFKKIWDLMLQGQSLKTSLARSRPCHFSHNLAKPKVVHQELTSTLIHLQLLPKLPRVPEPMVCTQIGPINWKRWGPIKLYSNRINWEIVMMAQHPIPYKAQYPKQVDLLETLNEEMSRQCFILNRISIALNNQKRFQLALIESKTKVPWYQQDQILLGCQDFQMFQA